MKIVYMGTPDFAVSPLRAIIEKGYEVSLVVTQPDKPKGRGHKMMPPEVKVCALEENIPVYQPDTMKSDEVYDRLKEENADLFIVAAYGKILPKRILEIPRYGCINIHASLLPKLRGAAPIQYSIINGETVTGVTTMQMDVGLDTGDMLVKEEVLIDIEDTGETLHDKLSVAGSKAILETLEKLENGTLVPKKQDDSLSSYAPMIDKTTGLLDFSKPTKDVYNLIRALNSYPNAYTYYNGIKFKVICAKMANDQNGKIGEILDVSKDGILVKCVDGCILISDVQFEGKKKMPVSEYIKGNTIEKGVILGGVN